MSNPSPLKNKSYSLISGNNELFDWFEKKDVASAVTWLKEQYKLLLNPDGWDLDILTQLIDQAFYDVTEGSSINASSQEGLGDCVEEK